MENLVDPGNAQLTCRNEKNAFPAWLHPTYVHDGKPVEVADAHHRIIGGTGRNSSQAVLGWILATFLVAVALLGRPLTGQRIATLGTTF